MLDSGSFVSERERALLLGRGTDLPLRSALHALPPQSGAPLTAFESLEDLLLTRGNRVKPGALFIIFPMDIDSKKPQ